MIDFPKNATIGDLYRPAMKITDQEEADEYIESLINWAVTKHRQSREKAEKIQRSNLGYFAGYFDSETMERVNRLFNTVHPIFGGKAPDSPEKTLRLGMKMGEKVKKGVKIRYKYPPKKKPVAKKKRVIKFEGE